MLLTERAIRQLIYNILLEGVREDADALRTLLADAPAALRQFEPLSMKPKWVNWLADRYVRNKYPADDTLKDALPVVAAFAAVDAAISQKYGSNPQFAASVDTSFPPSERKWTNPADAAAMSTADMDTLLTIYKRPKDKLGIDREDVSWKNDEVGTFGPWKLYFPTNRQNSINIAGADPVTHRPYTDWCTARTSSENLFNNYAAEGTMLFYAINTTATPEDQESRISLGFIEGELDVSGEYGGITVDGENTGLTSSDLQRIFGGYYTSIIARAKEVVAEHGGVHPIGAELDAAAKDPVKFNSMLRGLGAEQAGDQANAILSKDRDVSPEVAAVAANHKYDSVRVVAAAKEGLPAELNIKLAGDPDVRVRSAIAVRKDLPKDLIVKLAEDPSARVRAAIAMRQDIPLDLVVKLAGDSDEHVRSQIAYFRKDLPPDLIVKLVGDPSARVRANITSRVTPELYFKFAEDPDDEVRSAIATVKDLPKDLIVKLAGDPSARVRAAIAVRQDIPLDLVVKLAGDPAVGVRRQISYRKKGTLPTDLIVKLAGDSDDYVRGIISRRGDLPPGLVVKLSESRRLAHRILREIKRSARI